MWKDNMEEFIDRQDREVKKCNKENKESGL